jgi:AraC family ethanolamine operon transcriptional activator
MATIKFVNKQWLIDVLLHDWAPKIPLEGVVVMDEICKFAPELCIHPSDDANQQAEDLINWAQAYDQITDGTYRGRIVERRFSRVHVFREESNRGLRQDCQVTKGGLWLGLSATDKSLYLNHHQQGADDMLLRASGLDFELLTPEDFSIYGVVLDEQALGSILDQMDIKIDSLAMLNQVVSTPHAYQLKAYLSILLSNQPVRWSCDTHESLLLDFIADVIYSSSGGNDSMEPLYQRAKVMKRVKQTLESSDWSHPMTISELCSAVHVSRRTLQNTFHSCCGMSPHQFLLRVRLNQARRALLTSDGEDSVYDIAFNHGFFHLGLFAGNYKKLFGESPSMTLVRWDK